MLGKNNSVFLSTVCLSLETIVDDSIPTACTNGKYIKFNPDFFLSLTEEERVFVLAHETLHVVFIHMSRRGNRDPRLWNVAGDYVINLMLHKEGFKLCKGVLFDQRFEGMTTEEVYDLLLEEDNQEKPDHDDVVEAEFASEAEAKAFVDEITDTVVRAKMASDMAGNGSIDPAIQRFLAELLQPKLNWKALLKKYVSNTVERANYSWKKPKSRGSVYLPRLRSLKVGQIDIAIDTSGSVTDKEFNQFLSEVFSVLNTVKPSSIGLIQWDHELRSNDQLKSVEDFKRLPFNGGGGTCVSTAFEGFKQNKSSQLLVIITDGYLYPEPPVAEKRPVLWVVHNHKNFTPPWNRKDKVIHYKI